MSLASARALYERLSRQVRGGWTPASIVREGTRGLTERGVTRQKAGYLFALAERIERGNRPVMRPLNVTNKMSSCHHIFLA